MGFLSAIGGILGGIAGPFGAAAGAGIGSLLEGKKPKDALISAGLAGGTNSSRPMPLAFVASPRTCEATVGHRHRRTSHTTPSTHLPRI